MAPTPQARAQDEVPARPTDRGRLMLGGGVGAFWSHDDSAGPWPHYTEQRAYATPAVTYFVRDGIGLGVLLGGLLGRDHVRYESYGYDLQRYEAWAGLSSMFELRLGTRTGLLALVRLSYVREWRRVRDVHLNGNAPGRNLQSRSVLSSNPDYNAHLVRPSLFVPLVIHASSAVSLGFGPEVWADWLLSSNDEGPFSRPTVRYSLGASSWIGVSF